MGCNNFFAYFASTPNLLLSIIYTIKNYHIAHELPDPVVLLGNVGWVGLVGNVGGRVGLAGIAAESLDLSGDLLKKEKFWILEALLGKPCI